MGWVLGALEEIRHKLVCSEPSVAILPLGTGENHSEHRSPEGRRPPGFIFIYPASKHLRFAVQMP